MSCWLRIRLDVLNVYEPVNLCDNQAVVFVFELTNQGRMQFNQGHRHAQPGKAQPKQALKLAAKQVTNTRAT